MWKKRGQEGVGLTNSGFDGIVIRKGEKYNFSTFIRQISASTDYKLEYPDYKGTDYKNITKSSLEKASSQEYSGLLKTHLDEYRNNFQRVDFIITPGQLDLIPTDECVQAYKTSQNDAHLVELIFQYGRYL